MVDPVKEKLIWSWGPGQIQWQHHPTLLENGNLLIFDNGSKRKYTCVIELEPVTKRVIWEYKSKPEADFYSAERCGNTLISDSDSGRVFETTMNGKIVWEYYNPNRYIEEKNQSNNI